MREISSQKTNEYAKTNSLSKMVEEELGDVIDDKVILKRVGFSITPELKSDFEKTAKSLGMNLTEFLRRAGRAAQHNPDILSSQEIEEAEAEYKDAFRPSRWTHEPD
ncbi:hypothetical protein MACH17_28600 [Phaeobacter inhibens]|uniref:hypothetical protein n=1 Tax=Phaeobacter inhibens TaxID=221822 RepID=UPI002779199C|nr:hypothetical protein [Phaeobacter inhibens]GLO71343.1 hypothetical protein MACH17_28600 [Phaeobacter inhibens]